jgi:hypothetical protein
MAWNPSDKNANVTLSNNNRTAESTSLSDYYNCRAVWSVSSGKIYFELTRNRSGFGLHGGIATTAAPLSGQLGGANSWIYNESGDIAHNGTWNYSFGASWTSGDILGVAFDVDNSKIWFAINNVWQGSGDPANGTNPALTGVTGTIYGIVSLYDEASTINDASGDATYSPPSGFSFPPESIETLSDNASAGASGNAENLTRRLSDGLITGASGNAENLTKRLSDGPIAGASGSSENLTKGIADGITSGASGDSENLTRRISDNTLTASASGDHNAIFNRTITPDGPVAGASGSSGIVADRSISDGPVAGASGFAINQEEIEQYKKEAKVEYHFTLNGDEIPISNFQGRLRSGEPTYLKVTIPDYSWADTINNNQESEYLVLSEIGSELWAKTLLAQINSSPGMVLYGSYYSGNQYIVTQEIMSADVYSIDFYEGATSKSIVMTGKRTRTVLGQNSFLYDNFLKRTIGGDTYYDFSKVDFFIRPNDTVIIGDDTIDIEHITYTVKPGSELMTIKAK